MNSILHIQKKLFTPGFHMTEENGNNPEMWGSLRLLVDGKYPAMRRGRKPRVDALSDSDHDRLCKYLENPTKSGIWKYQADWHATGGISRYFIKKPMDDIFEYFGDTSLENFVFHNGVITNYDEVKLFDKIRFNLTLLFDLFLYFKMTDEASEKERNAIHYHLDEDKKKIFENMDYEGIRTHYNNAYNIFLNEIYSDTFTGKVVSDRPFTIRGHKVFFEKLPMEDGRISVISFDPEPLRVLEKFYQSLGKTSKSKVKNYFSPEEEIFAPYFLLVQQTYKKLIESEKNRKKFSEAVNQYESEEYTHCVNTLGLISEEYLVQVYETYFRMVCPRVPLGEIFEKISAKVIESFPEQTLIKPNAEPLYLQMDEIEKKSDTVSELNKDFLLVIRNVIYHMQEIQKYEDLQIESQGRGKEKISIFPRELKEKIAELIRYRNAASHRSSIHITQYEAQRTLYCLVSLISWWNEESGMINWEEDQSTILKNCIERSGYRVKVRAVPRI